MPRAVEPPRISAAVAAALVKPGDWVDYGLNGAQPIVFDRALAARAVGDPRRVLAGTDCGFDSSAGLGQVADSVVWEKLRALRDGAALATKRLF